MHQKIYNKAIFLQYRNIDLTMEIFSLVVKLWLIFLIMKNPPAVKKKGTAFIQKKYVTLPQKLSSIRLCNQ